QTEPADHLPEVPPRRHDQLLRRLAQPLHTLARAQPARVLRRPVLPHLRPGRAGGHGPGGRRRRRAAGLRPVERRPEVSDKQTYDRFSRWQRMEHILLILSFTTLAVTGLPQKFMQADISRALISLMGGIETTRQIHHTAAIVLMLESVYHFVAVG